MRESNLPPGVGAEDVPGNRAEDEEWDRFHEQLDEYARRFGVGPDELLRRVVLWPQLAKALERAAELHERALPKFNWGASALDAKAIELLNEVPLEVSEVLSVVRGEDEDEGVRGNATGSTRTARTTARSSSHLPDPTGVRGVEAGATTPTQP